MMLTVPDLSGAWDCVGQPVNPDKLLRYAWEGEVIIVQRWDRIRVCLQTKKSGSNSMAATLIYDEVDGFRLMYSYKNDPKNGQAELTSHCGYTELTFDNDLRTTDGEYFNGQDRCTFGRMTLKKR